MIVVKIFGFWFAMVVGAVLNGVIRESLLNDYLSENVALPISGLLLSLIIFGISYIAVGYIPKKSVMTYLGIGLVWVLLTLSFEYGLGYYVLGKSWSEISEIFDVASGNLFALVLLVTLFSAWFSAAIKGYLRG